MIWHGDVASIVQVLTLVITAERLAVYGIKLLKGKGGK